MARRIKRRINRIIFEFKPFSRKQKQILTWWTDKSAVKDKKGIIADGAIRSGKTLSMSLSYVMWAMYCFNNTNFGMAGKTIGSFRRNVVFWLKLMLFSRGYHVKDNRTENVLEVSYKGKVNRFYIFGGSDEGSQDLVQGLTAGGFFFDEVALMPESFVNQATGRCSVPGSKWWFNCNPQGPFHWFKTNWIEELENKRLIYLHFTMDDNLSLDEQTKDDYRNMYTGVFFQRYILGLWTAAEGVIYDMFSMIKHVVESFAISESTQTYISVDYGTQNATVFLLWQKGSDGIWYCVKEYYYSGRDNKKQKTDSEFADDLEEFVGNLKITKVVVDPSAASFIAELKKRGFSVRKARNDVVDGIRFTGSLLNEEKIKFLDVCKKTIKEFGSYVWDEKAEKKGEDKPVKQHDHAMDAVRYFCYTIIKSRGGTSVWK